jgi:malate dehydrogenase (oxaloacetate-decarboxylating)
MGIFVAVSPRPLFIFCRLLLVEFCGIMKMPIKSEKLKNIFLPMQDLGKKSLALHKKYGGKTEVRSKVSLKNKGELSIVYTPGVAKVCREIFRDKSLAKIYTIKKNTVAVVTDGSAVLGLGNLGPLAALPVMEGKCVLFKQFANVDAFPICLGTQDTEDIIATVKNIAPVFGGINLEDISAPRCFEIEQRLKAELDIPVFHDDQHGTAVVVLAGLINALKLKKLPAKKAKIVISGAGAAGTAITDLLMKYGFKNVVVCDSKGIIGKYRDGLNAHKRRLAFLTGCRIWGKLSDALKFADVFVGVSAPDILTPTMIKTMAAMPVIFALANPQPEISPASAKRAGAFIVATGRSDNNNQINNVLVFPGIFRGALDHQVVKITPAMLIKAAENLAALVKKPKHDRILPDPFDKGVAQAVARAIA